MVTFVPEILIVLIETNPNIFPLYIKTVKTKMKALLKAKVNSYSEGLLHSFCQEIQAQFSLKDIVVDSLNKIILMFIAL